MKSQGIGIFLVFLLGLSLVTACKGPIREARGPGPELPDKFFRLKLDPSCSKDDPAIAQIEKELEAGHTVLSLMESYVEELKKQPGTDSRYYKNLERLFACGTAPEHMEGHFHGLTLYLKKGDDPGGEFLNQLWGYSLGSVSPWEGKILRPARREDLKKYTQGYETGKIPTFMGINGFQRFPGSALNQLSVTVLEFVMNLQDATPKEKARFGYQKKGGLFIAKRAYSVDPADRDKEVFQLNYRWKGLGNTPPSCYLIDEMVEIAEGLYLGRLLYATRNLASPYDPQVSPNAYGYQNFGFFLLMDEAWRKLGTQGSSVLPGERGEAPPDKLTRFTFLDSCVEDPQIVQIKDEMAEKGSVLDLLKSYSLELSKDPSTKSPYFDKLQKIFLCGQTPERMDGYLHGAVVAFKNEGFLKVFDLNTLNLKWPLARLFSPWTGKTFEPIQAGKLLEVTRGLEHGSIPIFWGANTYSTRWPAAKMAVDTMRALGIKLEKASPREIKSHDYNEKGFFFIARKARSVNPVNKGRTVFQFNYRWPRLKTFPPDNYCIDEIVKIGDGLYLGQLNYATNLALPYDPGLDPAIYKYQNFGFFLLMDDDWQERRLEISFDIPGQ